MNIHILPIIKNSKQLWLAYKIAKVDKEFPFFLAVNWIFLMLCIWV